MEAIMASLPYCACCGQIFSVMKRCVQCQEVFYCSRGCQVKDWGAHKSMCLRRIDSSGHDQKSIFTSESGKTNSSASDSTDGSPHLADGKTVRVDFHSAVDRLMASRGQSSPSSNNSGLSYLHNNQHHHDTPVFHEEKAYCDVYVKSNKQKHKLKILDDWTGQEILKLFGCHVCIPLEKMKVVHKGRLMTGELIRECVKPKAVFQVFGEKSADETGLDRRDISIMMAQMNIDRNSAVQALQKKNDLIDAIFEVSNKI
ncbi:uncharacterized protein LOC124285524 [Haliotis rubra]|uniref:uncharacterized protein LOC124285524 n=1 Tax=Haliotis rubra TaxID=36100 RepID=UPI001EE60DD4|nr:uncharacterized protein LOC124285524 [Haliotis rubra]